MSRDPPEHYQGTMNSQSTMKYEQNEVEGVTNQFQAYDDSQRASPWNASTPYASSYTSTSNAGQTPILRQPSQVGRRAGKNAEFFNTTTETLPNGLNAKTYFCKMCDYTSQYNQDIHSHIRRKHKKI